MTGVTAEGDARPPRRVDGRATRLLRRACITVVSLVVAGAALLAFGALTGRYQLVPVGSHGPDVRESHASLAVVVPVSARALNIGDVVLMKRDGAHPETLYRVSYLDSWTREVRATDPDGTTVVMHAGAQVHRLARVVPFVGVVFHLLGGVWQSVVMLFVALVLLARASVQRRLARAGYVDSRRRRSWRASGLAGLIVWALGVLTLTASATFSGTATVSQGSTGAGHMQLTVPSNCAAAAGSCGAGAVNRLYLGTPSAYIVPGDTMERGLDLTVDSNTNTGVNTGIMTGIKLQITASPSNALTDGSIANGLYIWIQGCSQEWTEAGTSPAFHYTCGGTTSNVLGTGLATTTVNSVIGTSGGATLSNVSTSANSTMYLDVALIFPSGASDSFQDLATSLSFTFVGTQRSGTTK